MVKREMSHEEMMEKAWRFINEMGISDIWGDSPPEGYFVKDINEVRDAYYSDLESGLDFDDESLEDFFKRHGIAWK